MITRRKALGRLSLGASTLALGPFLVLGDDRPRKNRAVVRAAYARFHRDRAHAPPLRFVGPPDDYVDEAEKARIAEQEALKFQTLTRSLNDSVLYKLFLDKWDGQTKVVPPIRGGSTPPVIVGQ